MQDNLSKKANSFTYDLDRMKQHIQCNSILIPKFSTFEELAEWLANNLKTSVKIENNNGKHSNF